MNSERQLSPALKKRLWTLLLLGAIVPAGFYCKLYTGPAANWVNNSFAGLLYEVFWCLLISLFSTKSRPRAIAAGVLTATCVLEFLQLWHPPFLELLRGRFIGAVVLGTCFSWSDFPYYVLGCGAGWLCLARLRRVGEPGS